MLQFEYVSCFKVHSLQQMSVLVPPLHALEKTSSPQTWQEIEDCKHENTALCFQFSNASDELQNKISLSNNKDFKVLY